MLRHVAKFLDFTRGRARHGFNADKMLGPIGFRNALLLEKRYHVGQRQCVSGRNTAKAEIRSPRRSSGIPTTANSLTAGYPKLAQHSMESQ